MNAACNAPRSKALVQFQSPIQQRARHREVGHQRRLIETYRNGEHPRTAQIVQALDVGRFENQNRTLRIGKKPLADSRVLHFDIPAGHSRARGGTCGAPGRSVRRRDCSRPHSAMAASLCRKAVA